VCPSGCRNLGNGDMREEELTEVTTVKLERVRSDLANPRNVAVHLEA